MVYIIQRNLLPEIRSQIGPWQPRDLEHLERILTLLQTGTNASSVEPEKKSFVRRTWPKKLNAVEASNDTDDDYEFSEDEVLALMRDTFFRKRKEGTATAGRTTTTDTERPKLVDSACFNCGEKGHLFRECQKPRKSTFCYLCGKKGVRTFDCDCPKSSKNASCLDRETEESDSDPGENKN